MKFALGTHKVPFFTLIYDDQIMSFFYDLKDPQFAKLFALHFNSRTVVTKLSDLAAILSAQASWQLSITVYTVLITSFAFG